jgi:hypothetical protein
MPQTRLNILAHPFSHSYLDDSAMGCLGTSFGPSHTSFKFDQLTHLERRGSMSSTLSKTPSSQEENYKDKVREILQGQDSHEQDNDSSGVSAADEHEVTIHQLSATITTPRQPSMPPLLLSKDLSRIPSNIASSRMPTSPPLPSPRLTTSRCPAPHHSLETSSSWSRCSTSQRQRRQTANEHPSHRP